MAKSNPRHCTICGKQRLLKDARGRVCYPCYPDWKQSRAELKERAAERLEIYEKLKIHYGECCWSCGRSSLGRRMNLDTDKQGNPRGLLCHICHRTASLVSADPERLEKLARYLRNFSEGG